MHVVLLSIIDKKLIPLSVDFPCLSVDCGLNMFGEKHYIHLIAENYGTGWQSLVIIQCGQFILRFRNTVKLNFYNEAFCEIYM